MALLLCVSCVGTHGQPVNEDEMKGIYVYKFLKFVEWHEGKGGDDAIGDVFRICVAGDERISAFVNALDQKPYMSRKISLVNLAKRGQAKDCQVVFVSTTEAWRYRSILSEVNGHATLTISDIPDFIQQGGMIEFMFDGDRLTFAINQAEIVRAGLYVNSQLLTLAKTVIK